MGFFANLFDKREKIGYLDGCGNIFNLVLAQDAHYPKMYPDIKDENYRTDLIGILAAYLDTKPREKCVRDTFGKDVIRYGTANGTCLIDTHPIQANLDTVFLPAFYAKHAHYSAFVASELNNKIDAVSTDDLANELLKANGIQVEPEKNKIVASDIRQALGWADAILDTFKFV